MVPSGATKVTKRLKHSCVSTIRSFTVEPLEMEITSSLPLGNETVKRSIATRMNTWILYARCVSCWTSDHLQGKFKPAWLFQKNNWLDRYMPGVSSYVKKWSKWRVESFLQAAQAEPEQLQLTIRLSMLSSRMEEHVVLLHAELRIDAHCTKQNPGIRGPYSPYKLPIGPWSWGCYESTRSRCSKNMVTSRSSFRYFRFWGQANKAF